MAATGSIRPQTVQEAVLRELRRRISDGELRPGTVIRVDTVADDMDVSRIPVREALMMLEGEGLVTHRPHVGFAVPSLTAEDLEEIYWLRAMLEDEALRRALKNADATDHAAARQACAAAEHALARGDANGFSEYGRQFHTALMAPCGMRRLIRVLDGLWDATETYRPAKSLNLGDQGTLQAEHEAMLQAYLHAQEEDLVGIAREHRKHLLVGAQLGAAPTNAK